MAELPTGTVTFLFTDLEVSTRLWEQEPDAMRGALARHDLILRQAVVSHGGHVVKGTGDGVHVVFATADAAVRAAIDAQLVLAAEQWDVSEALRVRIGIHTGVAELRDGDYFGPTVNRAARVMSAGHGGQIVLSLASAELVRDGLPPAAELVDLGEHHLRDVGRAERVFQIRRPGLRADFPALRALEQRPGELPVFLTSFIGRQAELTSLADAIGQFRVVTLIGVGGVGKTRLAIQATIDARARFSDGASLCELASVTDRRGVVDAVAGRLGARQQPGESQTSSLLTFLRDKRLLLLLDNCEHVVEEAGSLVEAIAHGCPGVVVLATSREALGVEGERVCPVSSLAVPDRHASSAEYAAAVSVRLFADRAQAVRPEFALDASSAPVVADICRQLDGVPLAIELAAARVASLTINEIAQRLDQRLHLLTRGRRHALERHQTLRNAVDWSYDLLSEADARVFSRLAVFAGSFTLRAAEAVVTGGAIEQHEVLDRLSGLVARSMVAAEVSGSATRYRLHDTMRQYALEHLDAAGETEATQRRHAEYYAALAETARDALDTDFANVAAALDMDVTAGSVERSSRHVFHIALEGDWEDAQQSGVYRVSTRGSRLEDIGFIHAAFEHQIAVIGAVLYGDTTEPVVVLVIDTEYLEIPVVFENLEGGDESFPHLYGPLPTGAVVDVLAAVVTTDGRFVLRKQRA
jgi:predicted ATPase/class 3 adenylate cyclase/uncharacterized protein (DUF952 family)